MFLLPRQLGAERRGQGLKVTFLLGESVLENEMLDPKGHTSRWASHPSRGQGRKEGARPENPSKWSWGNVTHYDNSYYDNLLLTIPIAGISNIYILLSIYLFFTAPRGMWNFPDQGSSPCPLQWKRRVLTTGPPGKSTVFCIFQSIFIFDSHHDPLM